jgi:TonB family protein
MPLRCLLFSSSEELVQPIWQVLADLGIEGEYCKSAVDAVERVTTQLFQIVITDWEDQPEAAFLLKTARDLKAAHRPLILAIVGDDAGLPEALRAGANSVLVKPIRAEQARDTLSTACELLRSKFQPSGTAATATAPVTAADRKPDQKPGSKPEQGNDAFEIAAAAAAGAASAAASVGQVPEKTFRAGEFLTANSAPGAQFDTEPENDVQKSLDQAAISEVDALGELEPMASAVPEAPPEAVPAQTALTGWAALQARLTQPVTLPARQAAAEEAPAKSELLAYGETPSYGAAAAPPAAKSNVPKTEPQESAAEAALFAYMPGETEDGAVSETQPRSRRGKLIVMSALAVACAVLMAVPRTRASLQSLSRYAVRAAVNWLNPPPAPLPQPVPQHDSFGQSGDEYKLPTAENIPDATTDASQIRVLPVIDPTAKADKPPQADGGQPTTAENGAADSNQPAQNQPGQSQSDQNPAAQIQTKEEPAGQTQPTQIKDSAASSATIAPATTTALPPAAPPSPIPESIKVPIVQTVAPQPRLVTSTQPSVAPPHPVSASNIGIPSSLKSQMASSTPDASGNKSPEAAMSAIEPVNLTESAAREQLDQSADPIYPPAARPTAQRGSVVLQVQIARDGSVQEVKFVQGSLIFARPAIDAVRQWHFKPYSMNGRAVSVKSLITLNFKPPA